MLGHAPRIWQVGALCHAIADLLDARLNPVAVFGEISGFSRARSGHCYFSLKDPTGQIRCVMFMRAAGLLEFSPRDGELVDIRGRVGLYEPRGDLQLVVESMVLAGTGAMFEQFLLLKTKLEAEGLFNPARKRNLAPMPRGIGIVTSRGAAALHDVISTLKRRVPHIPVVVAFASVQGASSAAELSRALNGLYQLAGSVSDGAQPGAWITPSAHDGPTLDAILLVRGGGSIEDLWAFNDEALARVIARSPVPVISGVGHETDFTIADFVADLRAPTPTAAAEIVAPSQIACMQVADALQSRLQNSSQRRMDTELQRIDNASARLGRPSRLAAVQRMALVSSAQRLRTGARSLLLQKTRALGPLQNNLPAHLGRGLRQSQERLERARLRLGLLDPLLVLQRGYAWLTNESGMTITSPDQVCNGQRVHATVAGGTMDMTVQTRT